VSHNPHSAARKRHVRRPSSFASDDWPIPARAGTRVAHTRYVLPPPVWVRKRNHHARGHPRRHTHTPTRTHNRRRLDASRCSCERRINAHATVGAETNGTDARLLCTPPHITCIAGGGSTLDTDHPYAQHDGSYPPPNHDTPRCAHAALVMIARAHEPHQPGAAPATCAAARPFRVRQRHAAQLAGPRTPTSWRHTQVPRTSLCNTRAATTTLTAATASNAQTRDPAWLTCALRPTSPHFPRTQHPRVAARRNTARARTAPRQRARGSVHSTKHHRAQPDATSPRTLVCPPRRSLPRPGNKRASHARAPDFDASGRENLTTSAG
jgi:hypothetical protein